jgi:hypothetical protein
MQYYSKVWLFSGRLKKDKELLREMPEEFLIDADMRIQTIRRILHIKKMSPEQRSTLSQSFLKTGKLRFRRPGR